MKHFGQLLRWLSLLGRWQIVCRLVFGMTTCTVIVMESMSVWAQPPVVPENFFLTSQYRLNYLNTENVLPNNSVLGLVQDLKGYMWLGTFNGIMRFDGVQGTNTVDLQAHVLNQRGERVRVPIKIKQMATMLADKHGNIWISLQNQGLLRYYKGTYTLFDANAGLTDDVGSAIAIDSSGAVLIGTDRGVFRLADPTAPIQPTSVQPHSRASGINAYVQDLLVDAQGGLWVATVKGLYYFPHNANAPSVLTTKNGLPDNNVKALRQINGEIWVGTNAGIARFVINQRRTGNAPARNASAGNVSAENAPVEILPRPLPPQARIYSAVWSFLGEEHGSVWIGTNDGVYVWHEGQKTLRHIDKTSGMPDNSVREILQDREGNIWCATYYGGAVQLCRGKFSMLTAREGLVGDIGYCVIQARDSSMWFAMYGGVQRFKNGTFTTFTEANGLRSPMVRSLCETNDGAIWVATYRGLHKIVGNRVVAYYSQADGLPSDQIRVVRQTRDGALWIGTTQGLACFQHGRFTVYTKDSGLSHSNIISLYEDRAGRLWVGTNAGGVNILEHGRWSVISTNHRLLNTAVFAMYEDRDGTIWVAANGGLNRVRRSPKGWQVQTLGTQQGLPDEDVFDIRDDGLGNLWLPCNQGIICLSLADANACADGKIDRIPYRLYNRADGLATNNPTVPGTSWKAVDGRLWFPLLKGFAVLDPSNIQNNAVIPDVHIEQVVTDTLKTLREEQNSQELANLVVEPGTTKIELHYTATSLTAPENVRFRFKLDGVDAEWVNAGTRRVAYYNNVAPGTYTFRVIACNNDGIWNETGATLVLKLKPYFYQTWWFRVFMVLVAATLLWGVFRLRTLRLRARARQLQQMVQERTQELERSNKEIQRQVELLDKQAHEISAINLQLHEQNMRLEEANHELAYANEEISRQQEILQSQAADIELANSVLQERNVLLEQLNQEKNEFLGIAAHDLKNPLAAIQMTAAMVMRYFDKMDKQQIIERMEAITTSTQRMMAIITNLLDINAIESGSMRLSVGCVNVATLVRQCVYEYAERAQAKSITLHSLIADERIEGYADPNALMEVLDNLISNAIKYSPAGKNVWVSLARMPDKHSLLIAVQDEGPGMTEDDKRRLFGKFARLSAQPTGGESSTGLGLSIVKKMVEAMRGRVWCESTLGAGATFFVELHTEWLEGEEQQTRCY